MEIGELPESTPWFPRKMVDLDTFADKVLEMGEELDSDHPGAKDASYRARRAEITKIAKTYKTYVSFQVLACTKPFSLTWHILGGFVCCCKRTNETKTLLSTYSSFSISTSSTLFVPY